MSNVYPPPATYVPGFWSRAAKFGVALAGIILQALNAGLIPEDAKPWVAVGLAVLTALGVYNVPNAQPADPDAVRPIR